MLLDVVVAVNHSGFSFVATAAATRSHIIRSDPSVQYTVFGT